MAILLCFVTFMHELSFSFYTRQGTYLRFVNVLIRAHRSSIRRPSSVHSLLLFVARHSSCYLGCLVLRRRRRSPRRRHRGPECEGKLLFFAEAFQLMGTERQERKGNGRQVRK